ncbi:MAG: LLM class flavin-dependent oxidoreductase [Gaiellaceae bacterium]
MELGLFLSTHGASTREEGNWWHQDTRVEDIAPVESAQLAERLGFHSVWMGDHVSLPEESPGSVTPIGGVMQRHYPPRSNIIDGTVVMGAIANATSRIKMAPGVLLAPYRHPLSDARQFMTVDVLSGGRLIMGVGTGWMKEEFEALGHTFFGRRLAVLESCIDIYDQAWREGIITKQDDFYDFENMGVFPLPPQRPRPPIVVGATGKKTARLIAEKTDGFFPILTRPDQQPEDYVDVQEAIRVEADKIGRDTGELANIAFCSFRLSKADEEEATRQPRWNLGGTPDQILSDLERYARCGYSLAAMAPICPTASYAEFEEQAEWLARDVLPEAKKIAPSGGWRNDI